VSPNSECTRNQKPVHGLSHESSSKGEGCTSAAKELSGGHGLEMRFGLLIVWLKLCLSTYDAGP